MRPHLEPKILQNLSKMRSGEHLQKKLQKGSENDANMAALPPKNKHFAWKGLQYRTFAACDKTCPDLPQNAYQNDTNIHPNLLRRLPESDAKNKHKIN